MMFDFDEIIERRNTNCTKYDGLKRVFGVSDAKPLWVADMDFATPNFVLNAINQKLSQKILGYEEISFEWFSSIIRWYSNKELIIDEHDIAFSPGVVTSLALCVEAFSEIGDEIIVQPPVYYPFFSVIKDNKRNIIENPLIRKNGKYFIDFNDLKTKISHKTKIIFLCSPHNPVGRIWDEDELIELCKIAVANNIIIVSDEIHSDLIFKPFVSLIKLEQFLDSVVVLNSPSKTFNLAGISSSYVICKNKKLLNNFKKAVKSKGLHANSFSYVSTVCAYRNGEFWLNELLHYLESNFKIVNDFCMEYLPQIEVNIPDATYLMWLDFHKFNLDNSRIEDILLNQAKLALNNGKSFGNLGDGFMRLNVALPASELEHSLLLMKKGLEKFTL